jgi:hypothetical protein
MGNDYTFGALLLIRSTIMAGQSDRDGPRA